MEEHYQVILTRLEEGMPDVLVSDIYLVALGAYESEAVLVGLKCPNSLLPCETRLDVHILKNESLVF